MSTRSDIIVHMSDDTWARIYCHNDGYLEHNGQILFEHYTDQKKAEALIKLGDLSVLGPEIGKKHPWMNPHRYDDKPGSEYMAFREKYGAMCVAYARDRGDKGTKAITGPTLASVWPETDTWCEFTYVWHDGKWFAGNPDEGSQTLADLGKCLTGEYKLTPDVKAFGMVIGEHLPHDPKKPHDHKWAWYR